MKHAPGQLYGNTRPPGRRCVGCGRPSGASRCCGRPKCVQKQRALMRGYDAKRRALAATVCRFCPNAPLPDRRVCERHSHRRADCPGFGVVATCSKLVPYNDDARRQPVHCSERCRRAMTRLRNHPTTEAAMRYPTRVLHAGSPPMATKDEQDAQQGCTTCGRPATGLAPISSGPGRRLVLEPRCADHGGPK